MAGYTAFRDAPERETWRETWRETLERRRVYVVGVALFCALAIAIVVLGERRSQILVDEVNGTIRCRQARGLGRWTEGPLLRIDEVASFETSEVAENFARLEAVVAGTRIPLLVASDIRTSTVCSELIALLGPRLRRRAHPSVDGGESSEA